MLISHDVVKIIETLQDLHYNLVLYYKGVSKIHVYTRNNHFQLQNMYLTPRKNNTTTTTHIATCDTLFAGPLPFGWFCVQGSSRVSDPARFRFRAPPVGMPSGGLNKQTNKQTNKQLNKHHNKPRHLHYLFLQSIISLCLALEFLFTS